MTSSGSIGNTREEKAPRDVLSDQAYKHLEAEILSGRWRPGARLSLRTLAETLEMSIQPIRDAVSRLIALSALESTAGRSVRVPRVTKEIADELWAMRLLLESEIAALAAERRSQEQLESLFGIAEKMAKLEWAGNAEINISQTLTWNGRLVAAANSPMLAETVFRLQMRYAPFLADSLNLERIPSTDFLKYTHFQQHELVLAIQRQDVVSARHLRSADLRTFQRYLYWCHGWEL